MHPKHEFLAAYLRSVRKKDHEVAENRVHQNPQKRVDFRFLYPLADIPIALIVCPPT